MEEYKIVLRHKNTKLVKGYTDSSGSLNNLEELEYIEEENERYYYISASMRIEKKSEKKIKQIKQRKQSLLTQRLREKENQERKERMEGKIP